MADFNKAIINILKNEGGFNKDLGDGQGMTYRGLTIKSDPDFTGWAYIKLKLSQGIKIKEEQIFNELEQNVKDYYKAKYWSLIKGEQLENQDIANMCLSFVVASGQARKVINQAINKAFKKEIPVVNQFTDQTIWHLNKYPVAVYPVIYDERLNYMKGLSTWQKFGRSWLRMMSFFPKTITPTQKTFSLLTAIGLSIIGFLIYKKS